MDWQSGVVTPFSASTDEESHVEGSGSTTTVGINDIVSDIESGTSEEEETKETGSSAATCNGVAILVVSAALTTLVNLAV